MAQLLVPTRRPIVLVVDDVAANRELLEGYLSEAGYDVRHGRDGLEALQVVEQGEPDLILLDVDMPRMDGLEVCRRIKAHPTWRLIPVVLITALHERETKLRGLAAGADDFLTKPFDAQELLVRAKVLLRDRELNSRLDAAESVILALGRVIEARDLYTVHHAERVGRYAREIGQAYGLVEADLDVLYKGGVLHDLGKAVIPAEILLKPGPLTDEEYAVMTMHSAKGEAICQPLRSASFYLPIIRHHHERWDGRGYPDRLAGKEIPVSARIVAVADAWDAMLSARPYRPGLERQKAIEQLRSAAGHQWDATFVEIFLSLVDKDLVERVTAVQPPEATA